MTCRLLGLRVVPDPSVRVSATYLGSKDFPDVDSAVIYAMEEVTSAVERLPLTIVQDDQEPMYIRKIEKRYAELKR